MQLTEQQQCQRPYMNNSSQNENLHSSAAIRVPTWINNMLQGIGSRLQQTENQFSLVKYGFYDEGTMCENDKYPDAN